ncbi:MAG: glycoside hydrolase family 97 catalytic domain-containing protein, partial [Verrucomicrobiae bacterium]|nr:glycoside hydrolase family 97 catalytic domain-containing protein [Verrucomicrobiae bacterium]
VLPFVFLVGARADTVAIHSPDQQIEVVAGIDDSGAFRYSLEAFGQQVILPSAAAVQSETAMIPGADWKLVGRKTTATNSAWRPLWGKRSVVPDRYRQSVFQLQGPGSERLDVAIRVYDDGIALRYEVPANGPAVTAEDRTEFRFAGDFTTWGYNGENHNHGPEPISAIQEERPPVITLQAAPDVFLAIHEADLRQGDPLMLEKAAPTAFVAKAKLGKLEPGTSSPWRVIFCGRTPGDLVDSHLLELLNPDPVGDFSWVKPGVCTWDWRIDGAQVDGFTYGMNYESWVRMIDFSAANGMKHLVLDANWYGPEHEQDSDPVKGDKANDVKKIIAYGKRKNVGVWLYLNDVGGRQFPLEETLAHYGEWGAAGVKYGFMKGTPEEKNQRTRLITELCAKHKLLCNFHDSPVHPYGQMRTWPNAVTREYNFAQLDARKVFYPKTFVTSVFVNMLAGPIDMNNGFFDLRQGRTTRVDNPMECPSTVVGEAARTLITFSGATIIPDIPEFYQKYPDLLRFIAAQQMPWRESKTLSGVIGEHIVMARQSAKGEWLVGAATNEEGRELEVKLDFLPQGSFKATIVQDGEDGSYLTNRETHRSETREVTAADTLRLKLAPGGGACVQISKQ